MSPSHTESLESLGSSGASSARCPRCRRVFDCGARGDRSTCWCVSMPALPAAALKADTGCLCPECLADAIARERASSQGTAASPE